MDNNNINLQGGQTIGGDHKKEVDFFALAMKMIAHLPARTQDIVKKRYGLSPEEGKTLEKIGQEYSITRERVRQIISDAIRSITNMYESEEFKSAESLLVWTIEKNNGIIKESELIKKYNKDGLKEANAIKFFSSCSKKIKALGEKGIIENSWVLSDSTMVQVKDAIGKAQRILEKEGNVLTEAEMAKKVSLVCPSLNSEKILDFLSVSSKIRKNKFGKWGLNNWAEISPKGTREKIYLVLKEKKQPLHFGEIAGLIDEYKLGKKKAHPQTVHNELIKDRRFVLIGRGIYALAEWGYSEGTIKDVIKEILEKSEKPLGKEEILEKVFKIRKVKKATVMINLNNGSIFEKNKNLYTVKK